MNGARPIGARQPWRLEVRSSCIAIIDANGQEILFIQLHPEGGGENGSVTARGRTNEEIMATARLVMLAPELRGGCEMAWNELTDPSSPTGVALRLRTLLDKEMGK